MRKIKAFFVVELKSLLREPVSLFFMIILPIILTIVFGGAFGSEATQYGDDVLGIDVVVPVNIVFLLANAGLMGIPITILELKEQGVIKRYITYPISYRTHFTALILAFSVVSIASTLLFSSIAALFYGAQWMMNGGESLFFLFMFALNVYLYYAIGFLFSLLIKSARTANLVTSGLFLAMIFTSGVVLPVDSLPDYVKYIAYLFPMYHSIEVTQMLWIGELRLESEGANLAYLLGVVLLLFIVLKRVRVKWD
jgi:ABC-2 type transport system permease protein